MTDKTTNPDTERDVEEETEQSLKTRTKAYLLAAYAYVAGAIAQSVQEIAPQLRNVSLPDVSSRAAKSILLAGVLITAAVAMPADPFGGGETTVETQDPVQGETYEATEQAPTFDSESMNQLPSTFTDGAADAPEPPDQVRASAGSQTMNVQTSVVDGEPAIVLEDDRTHDGRWVSLETAWFEEHLGEVPNAAFITHESGNEYAAPLQVRGDSAAFYVREFSTNTVTFDGEVRLSGDQAADGSQYQYELNNTEGVDDPAINLTGVNNTATRSTSAIASNGDTIPVEVGGTTAPQNAKVTFTGKSTTAAGSGSLSETGGSITIPSNQNVSYLNETTVSTGTFASPTTHTENRDPISVDKGQNGTRTFTDGPTGTINQVGIKHGYDAYIDEIVVYVDGEKLGSTAVGSNAWGYVSGDGIKVGDQYDITVRYVAGGVSVFNWGSGIYNDNPFTKITFAGTESVTYTSPTDSTTINSEGSTATLDYGMGDTITVDVSGAGAQSSLNWTEVTETQSPSVSISGETISHTGTLSEGNTVAKSVDLSRGSNTADVSTSAAPVGVNISWTEVSETRDPVVELNGETTGVSGTLADGETVSLSQNASALQEGTNRVNISTNSPTSGPASLVGFKYSHGAETTTSATVDETTWSQSTNVSKTWAGDKANATATIPMNDRVVSVRDVEVRYNETTWEPVSSSDYTLNGTDLTVQLGDVASGSTTEVRATGSKVRVTDGAITVLDPSTSSATLNTRIQIDDAGPDFALSVDETTFANRVHYAENATWGAANGSTTISASGEQTFTLPDATAGAEATVRTWPIEVAPTTGTVTVPERTGDRTEPGIEVQGDGNNEVDYTFVDAKDATPYILYSETNGIVRDEGLASSPITLTDDNSDETLVFRVDDGGATGSGSGSDASAGGGPAPMEAASGGFTAPQALIPDGSTLLLGTTLLGGLFVVGRRSGVITEDRQQAATSAASSAAGTVGGLVERALANQIIVGALILGAGAFVLGTGVLPEQTRIIVGLATAPVAMYLALQQFGEFDFRIWVGSTAIVALLGLNVLAPGFFQTIAEEAGILIVVAGAYLGYKAISAYRADAETPDEQTNVVFEVDDDGGN